MHVGTNTVTIRVTFMRTTNIEALYLIGDFGVKIDGKKRTLTGLPKVVGCRNFEKYDLPFYTGAMTYHLTPAQYEGKLSLELEEGDRIVLSPIQATGGCIKVTTSKGTEILGWDPYEADVTDAVKRGETIDVTVVGTRRNVFGPLHELPRIVGGYGPGNFVTSGANWTDDYSLIDSGLRGIALKVQKKYN